VVLEEASVEKVKRVATRSEGVGLEKDEVRGEAGERARPVGRVSSLGAQTLISVLSKQGVRWRSSASWPGRVIANHIPRSRSFIRDSEDLQGQIRATAK
jgi:hypothetical protein